MNIKFCTVNAHICMEYTIGWFFNWSPIKSTSFSHGGERGVQWGYSIFIQNIYSLGRWRAVEKPPRITSGENFCFGFIKNEKSKWLWLENLLSEWGWLINSLVRPRYGCPLCTRPMLQRPKNSSSRGKPCSHSGHGSNKGSLQLPTIHCSAMRERKTDLPHTQSSLVALRSVPKIQEPCTWTKLFSWLSTGSTWLVAEGHLPLQGAAEAHHSIADQPAWRQSKAAAAVENSWFEKVKSAEGHVAKHWSACLFHANSIQALLTCLVADPKPGGAECRDFAPFSQLCLL